MELKKGTINIPDTNNNLEYYIENNYTYPLLETEEDSVLIKYNLEKNPKETAGNIEIYLGDKLLHKEPLFSKEKEIKQKKSLLQKIKEFFKHDK